jgi:hypothetical protein
MNDYTLLLLARDRIDTFHREATGKRAPRRRGRALALRGATTMRMIRIFASIGAAAITLLALSYPATAADGLDAVRDATQEFRDVAVAEAAGYGILAGTPLEECIDEPSEGTMGFHYVNGDLVGDTVLEPTTPEALVYVPRGDGGLRFVAVEYVVFAEAWDAEHAEPPQLLGHELKLVTEPNRYELPAFYELHAWVGKDNPSGTFYEWNPTVSCEPYMPDTSVGGGSSGSRPSDTAVPLVVFALASGLIMAPLFARRRRSANA